MAVNTADLVLAMVAVTFLGWALGSVQEQSWWNEQWLKVMETNLRLLEKLVVAKREQP